MSYTNATVIIAAADQPAAQLDFPGSFNAGYYLDAPEANPANPAVATCYICSGLWTDSDLDEVVNEVLWSKLVKFGDVQAILDSMQLKQVVVIAEPAVEPAPEVLPK